MSRLLPAPLLAPITRIQLELMGAKTIALCAGEHEIAAVFAQTYEDLNERLNGLQARSDEPDVPTTFADEPILLRRRRLPQPLHDVMTTQEAIQRIHGIYDLMNRDECDEAGA